MSKELQRVAAALRASDKTVYLTGAGISVASGISPYRKGPDAVWANFIMDWGTKEKLDQDPLTWYREFWIKAHPSLRDDPSKVQPNPGHAAIAELVDKKPGHGVITQNIDGLHKKSGVPAERLIEIHGRHDVFVCSDARCPQGRTPRAGFDLKLIDEGQLPECELCGAAIRPLVLLFDELYDSQPFFRAREARRWLDDADVVVFCGTSFSVGITAMAVQAARYTQALMVNVNLEPADDGSLGFVDLLGRSEEVLPALAAEVLR
jgi:NAD-dependent SIR2 family protein deacetylase